MIPFSVAVCQDLDISSFVRTDCSLSSKGEERDKADSGLLTNYAFVKYCANDS